MSISLETFRLLQAILIPLFFLVVFIIAKLIQNKNEGNWFVGYEKQGKEQNKKMAREHFLLYGFPVIIGILMVIFL